MGAQCSPVTPCAKSCKRQLKLSKEVLHPCCGKWPRGFACERVRDSLESYVDPRGDIDVAVCRMRSCSREVKRQGPLEICEGPRVEDLEQPSHAAWHDDNCDVLCDQ
eukprot:2448037-Alexandrium_andersonii.AAC.1